MDVSNLLQNHQKLLGYLKENGYSKSHIQWIKKCIKAVLTDGVKPEIHSYEQLYWFEVKNWGWKEGAHHRFATSGNQDAFPDSY